MTVFLRRDNLACIVPALRSENALCGQNFSQQEIERCQNVLSEP